MVSDITASSPEHVEEDMAKLLEHYHGKEPHDLRDLAEFHAMFEQIHPFQAARPHGAAHPVQGVFKKQSHAFHYRG